MTLHQYKRPWRKIFALLPVKTLTGCWVWLEMIEAREVIDFIQKKDGVIEVFNGTFDEYRRF